MYRISEQSSYFRYARKIKDAAHRKKLGKKKTNSEQITGKMKARTGW